MPHDGCVQADEEEHRARWGLIGMVYCTMGVLYDGCVQDGYVQVEEEHRSRWD